MFTGSDGTIGSFRAVEGDSRWVSESQARPRQANILKSDIIARSNSRIKNVSLKYVEKNSLKYSVFFFFFFRRRLVLFSLRVLPHCSCADARPLLPYTLCFVFFLIAIFPSCGRVLKRHKVRVQVQVVAADVRRVGHSTAKPQVSSTAVSSFS